MEDILPAIAEKYGSVAAQEAADWYAASRETDIGEAWDPQLQPSYDADEIRKAITAKANELKGNPNASPDGLLDWAVTELDMWVRAPANRTVIQACLDDPLKPKWAREFNGETCTFCLLLASRGFVYQSKRTASFNPHHDCDCVPVPDYENGKRHLDTDYEGLYGRLMQCAKTIGADSLTITPELQREIEWRDWDWLATGKLPEITYESEKLREQKEAEYSESFLSASGTGRRRQLTELDTAMKLSKNGIACRFVTDFMTNPNPEERRTKEIVGLPDLAGGIELKTLTSAGPNSVRKYWRNVRDCKINVKRIVFDNSGNGNLKCSDSFLIDYLSRRKDINGAKVYVIKHDGSLYKARRKIRHRYDHALGAASQCLITQNHMSSYA